MAIQTSDFEEIRRGLAAIGIRFVDATWGEAFRVVARSGRMVAIPIGTSRGATDMILNSPSLARRLGGRIRASLSRKVIHLSAEDLGHLRQALGKAVGRTDIDLAISLGSPGAYRKATIKVFTASNEVVAYGKLAATELANEAVSNEATILTSLHSCHHIGPRVPRVMELTEWKSRRMLLLSPAPDARPSSRRFKRAHFRFLTELFRVTRRVNAVTAEELRPTESHLINLEGGAPVVFGEIMRALEYIHKRLRGVPIPTSLSHRDFGPWNVLGRGENLMVLDWEMARDAPVCHDVFHFYCAQEALTGRSPRGMRPSAARFVDSVWPGSAERINALYAAYLVDMTTFYQVARLLRPQAGDEAFLNWLRKELRAVAID